MELQLIRDAAGIPVCTHGRLSVNGCFFCHTLEPPPSRYRIPSGRFSVCPDYPSAKFRGIRPLVSVNDGHNGILIHEGNTAADTLGCILVGESFKEGRLFYSRAALKRLQDLLSETDDLIFLTVK